MDGLFRDKVATLFWSNLLLRLHFLLFNREAAFKSFSTYLAAEMIPEKSERVKRHLTMNSLIEILTQLQFTGPNTVAAAAFP